MYQNVVLVQLSYILDNFKCKRKSELQNGVSKSRNMPVCRLPAKYFKLLNVFQHY